MKITLRNIGLLFFLGGLMILLGYGAVMILATTETPVPVRLGILAMLIGFVVLLATLIREQYMEANSK
jgi:hypothetical protein